MTPTEPASTQAVPIWPPKTRAKSIWFRPLSQSEDPTTNELQIGWSETELDCEERTSQNFYLMCPPLLPEAQPCFFVANLQVQTKPNAK